MYGASRHAHTNRVLNQLMENRPVVVSHGGVTSSSIPVNTTLAVRAALHSLADIVKIDVSASSDNVFYAFHDGHEQELLGVDRNIQSMSAAEIGGLAYVWHSRPGRRLGVHRLKDVLLEFRGDPMMFALDRSWWRWPTLLKVLDGLDMPEQLLLKVPAWETNGFAKLRQHKVKYPVLAICSTVEELDALPLGDDEVNIVGVELLAIDPESAWFDRDVQERIDRADLITWVNSETLPTGIPLFAGHDDECAVTQSPASAWTPLIRLGIDAIQTEFPWLLAELRRRRG